MPILFNPSDDGVTADSAVRHAPESPREDAMKCNGLQHNAAARDRAAKTAVHAGKRPAAGRRSGGLSPVRLFPIDVPPEGLQSGIDKSAGPLVTNDVR